MNAPKLPPPAAKPSAPPATGQAVQQSNRQFAVISGRIDSPQRILLYGAGGIGKSTLAALAPSPVFLDVESGTNALDVPRVDGLETFADLRACLQSNALDGYKTVVLDSVTMAEEMAIAHTIATVQHEKGGLVRSVEGYGFGKGYQHVYETFLLLLADLDRQIRQGRSLILVAHDCTADVPNPVGDDWIRYEPRLQAPKSGKASIRNRVVEWADHVLFLGYDVIAKDGKGKGGGTRTIYTDELPSHLAKSRSVHQVLPFTSASDATIWNLIFGGAK